MYYRQPWTKRMMYQEHVQWNGPGIYEKHVKIWCEHHEYQDLFLLLQVGWLHCMHTAGLILIEWLV
jgi:hypothetical protein